MIKTCFEDPTLPKCSNFQLSDQIITQDLDSVCSSMSLMPGCAMRELCEKSSNKQDLPYCQGFSLLADVCAKDMPKMKGCASYVSLCSDPASLVKQCHTYPALQSLPTTMQSRALVESICQEMEMTGCSSCVSDIKKCNALKTYTDLCYQMPGMSQCSNYNSMCSWNPSLWFCQQSQSPIVARPPAMKMFFHVGYNEYFLFEQWVPNGFFTFFLSCLFCFGLAIGYEFLLYTNAKLENRWLKATIAKNSGSSLSDPSSSSRSDEIESPLLTSSESSNKADVEIRVVRGLMRTVTITGGYILMLLVMSYNVAMFLSIVVGLGVGSYLWGHEIASMVALTEKEHCC